MRVVVFLVVMVCLQWGVSAQDRGDEPREAARRPISDLLEKLPLRLLPIPAPLEPDRADDAAGERSAHKLVLRVSEEWFTALVYREIDEQTIVEDVILGTPVSGMAHTIGQPRIDLVPHESQAAFDVVMEGTTVSRTTGRNGPAVIHSRSTTRFRAVKQVRFSPQKGFHSLPANVSTNTHLATENVASTRGGLIGRIVRRRAWQEVRAKHSQAQAIADAKARNRVAGVLDAQIEEGLAKLNRRNEVRGMIAALVSGTSEPRVTCCSTEHHVHVGASLQPAADRPIVLPRAEYLTSPVQLWVHRSVIRPQLPAILSRLGNGPYGMSGLVSFSQTAPVAFLGAELIKTAAANAHQSSPFDVETIEDWMVVEFGKVAQPGRVVRR